MLNIKKSTRIKDNDFLLLFRVYIFREPFLMVADPDMIKDILVKEFLKFHDRKVNIFVISSR